MLLLCKKFEEGWKENEWRWGDIKRKTSIGTKLKTGKPEWTHNKNGRVLLWAEQGLGDELLFLTLVPDFIEQVDKLIIKTDKRLIPLLKRTFGERIKFDTEILTSEIKILENYFQKYEILVDIMKLKGGFTDMFDLKTLRTKSSL